MRSSRLLRNAALTVLMGAPTVLWLACGGEGGDDLLEPALGALEIIAATSGPEPDPDGYTVSVDGGSARPIPANGTLRFEELASGPHTVALGGAAANCAVASPSATIEVVGGETASVRFTIACQPSTGSIQVTTSTGANADAEGYSLLLDGAEHQPIGADATVTIAAVPPGVHTVGINGLAANCVVQGDNPQSVTVVAGETVLVGIGVTCAPPPDGAGTLRVTTATSGPDQPAGGYTLSVDGGPGQPIGRNATVALSNTSAGTHAVLLAEVPGHCTVTGQNPRSVTVPADGSVEVSFEVTCTSNTGRIRVTTSTTGQPRDPDGYEVAVDGAAPRAIGANGNLTLDGLAAGERAVALGGVAGNCLVQGENPRAVEVVVGELATTTFAVVCAATDGELAVTISGLPGGVNAAVTVTGPGNFSEPVTATRTLEDLAPGSYTVAARDVSGGGTQYAPTPETQTVTVAAGQTAAATVTSAAAGGASLNLRIPGLYLTQSVQNLNRGVPLVAGRDGYLRVFALANETNTAQPVVRVRLYRDGTLQRTLTVSRAQPSTPTALDEETLARSWNVPIPASLIRTGLEIVADVDPDNTVPESDEADNSFPVSGERLPLQVRPATTLGIVLVPVHQAANQLEGDISEGNKDRFLGLTQRLFPLPGYQAEVHDVYTSEAEEPLDPNDANGAWTSILNEILALRVAEDDDRHYYGVVRTGYSAGMAGLGFVGAPAAVGYDDAADGPRVLAHELGHTWGRLHAPCGAPGGVDPHYPYPGGHTGIYGFDLVAEVLKPPTQPEIMGYCANPWVSDYTYEAILTWRANPPAEVSLVGGRRRSLLIWGRIVNGRAILEPAFEIMSRLRRPASGPYSVAGHSSDGARLFEVSFDAAAVADDPRGGRQFAFAVPLDDAVATQLESIRLAGPGIQEVASLRSAELRRGAAAATPPRLSRAPAGVTLRWDAAAYPMVMVRDPVTGEVLAFARGGQTDVRTGRHELDLLLSDGVRSRSVRVPTSAP